MYEEAAVDILDQWLEDSLLVSKDSSYYQELRRIVLDAVAIGKMDVLGIRPIVEDGELVNRKAVKREVKR